MILITLFAIGFAQAVKSSQPQLLPKDLNGAMDYIYNHWTSVKRSAFKNQSEDEAVSSNYFTTGLWIRNNWIHGNGDTALVNYFHQIGIHNPDDISSIILTSLHRKLNNQPIDLKKQVDAYESYWNNIDDCEKKSRSEALEIYNTLKIGDPVTIMMYVDTSDNNSNATIFECPSIAWKFDPKKDLKIKGVVKNIITINRVDIQIKSMSFPNIKILSDTVKIGEVKEFSLVHLDIKK